MKTCFSSLKISILLTQPRGYILVWWRCK